MRARRWLLWILVSVALMTTVSAAGVYFFLRALNLSSPSVRAGSTLVLEISGELPEELLYDLGGVFSPSEQPTFHEVIRSLDRAKADARVRSLLLWVRGASIGWARAEELRASLLDFKDSGKSLVAYVEGGGNLDYFLATAADAVYLHPQAVLDVRGVSAEVVFMKSLLDHLGIEAEFEQIGEYKNAPDTFTRESMSEHHREALEDLVGDVYGRLVEGIAAGRGLAPAAVRRLLDRGPFPAREAKEAGLVDELLYEDEVEARLEEEADYQPVSVGSYHRSASRPGLAFDGRRRIALIYGLGAIVSGESVQDPLFGQVMGSDTVAASFEAIREDDSIEAVVFRIDSPGGSDVASDVIWREASLTMEKKPVVVSMSDYAASGGYWIATASNAIVAEPTTITGSIGIYAGKLNLAGLYEKIGLHSETVARGDSATFWSDARSFTPEERRRLRRILEEGYRRFLEKVAASRDMTPGEVDALGQGRVWTGARAAELGLVDELGGLDRAIALAREKAEIPESERVEIVVYPRRKTLFEYVLDSFLVRISAAGGWKAIAPERLLADSAFLRLFREGDALALMPYRLELR